MAAFGTTGLYLALASGLALYAAVNALNVWLWSGVPGRRVHAAVTSAPA
jgi:hypothetical protein